MINFKNLSRKFLIFFILFFFSSCQIKIPLTYFPVYEKNFTSPSGIMQYLIDQKVYANLEIGNPKVTIQIPLNFEVNDFYIIDKSFAKFEDNNYKDIQFYDLSKTDSHEQIEYYESYQTDYFLYASYDKDIFYFNNKSYELEFYMPIDDSNYESGGIGMNILSESSTATPNIEKTFFEKLKKAGLLKGYYWTIFYNSENTEDNGGTLLMGILPHELDSDLGYYKKENFNIDNRRTVNIEKKTPKLFKIDYIYAYEGNNKNKKITDFPSGSSDFYNVELDYHLGGIRAPTRLRPYYERVFEKYINQSLCFTEKISRKDINYYYCKNEKKVISEIKNSFPGISLTSFDLNYNFTFEAKDLFIEKNGYVFCLLFFGSSTTKKNWEMGRPFLKKYLFTINQIEKYISFYGIEKENNENSDTENEGISTTTFVLAIFGTIILVSIICFLIFKFYLYDKYFRKKRANELEEDGDYDYSSKNDKASDALNINNFT